MENAPIKKTPEELMKQIHGSFEKIFGPKRADVIELWRQRNGDKLKKLIESIKKWMS